MSAKEPTPADLWERAGYLRAAANADADAADANAADAAASAAYAYVPTSAAADADDAVDVDAFDAGMARWAREHPPKEGKP